MAGTRGGPGLYVLAYALAVLEDFGLACGSWFSCSSASKAMIRASACSLWLRIMSKHTDTESLREQGRLQECASHRNIEAWEARLTQSLPSLASIDAPFGHTSHGKQESMSSCCIVYRPLHEYRTPCTSGTIVDPSVADPFHGYKQDGLPASIAVLKSFPHL